MATTTHELRDDDPAIPVVNFRFDGPLREPIVTIPGVILNAADAVTYAPTHLRRRRRGLR